ncbi:MAG: ABC transporter permease [Alphaproteobacteria bacterium]|nr:ABC transporter permease [Alphaproteobacteria bacterium]
MEALVAIGRFGIFAGQVLSRLVLGPRYLSAFWRHTHNVVLRCMLPVVAVVFPFGMVIALQGLDIFKMFGAQRMLASLISVTVLRELSPVLASVLVAAQGGSAFAAELGSMRIKEELDATEVMAVDGLAFHVLPRVLALTLACPLLNMMGSIAGIAGGFFTAVLLKGEQAGVFLAELWAFTDWTDLWGGLLKTTVFGMIIGLMSCYLGYNARGGAAGVGRAVNNTVVYSVLVFITANYFMTSAIFGTTG